MKAQGPWSPGLFEHIGGACDEYDFFIFFGYLYAQTYFGLPRVAERAVLVPFAHDEWTIHLGMWDEIFAMAAAFVFSTPEERQFLRRRFPSASLQGPVVGVAIDRPREVDPLRFRAAHRLEDDILLYVGRIDASKGCHEMFEMFLDHAQATGDRRTLVLLGRAEMPVPDHPQCAPSLRRRALEVGCPGGVRRPPHALAVREPVDRVARGVVGRQAGAGERRVRGAACPGKARHGGLAYGSADEFSACLDLLSAGGARERTRAPGPRICPLAILVEHGGKGLSRDRRADGGARWGRMIPTPCPRNRVAAWTA
jgi:hypothetical protein